MVASVHFKYIVQLKKQSDLEDSVSFILFRQYYLLTKAAVVGKLLLKTLHTVIATVFGDQRFSSYWLSAMLTHKAGFMPVVSLKFHFAGTCNPKYEPVSTNQA